MLRTGSELFFFTDSFVIVQSESLDPFGGDGFTAGLAGVSESGNARCGEVSRP